MTVGSTATDLEVMGRDHHGECSDTLRRRNDNGGCWPHPVISWSDESRNDSFLSVGDAAGTGNAANNSSSPGCENYASADACIAAGCTSQGPPYTSTSSDSDATDIGCATSKSSGSGNDIHAAYVLEGERATHFHSCTTTTPDAKTGRALRQSFKGDIGLALFSPLVLENLSATSAGGSTIGRPAVSNKKSGGRSTCSNAATSCISAISESEEAVLANEPVRSRSDSDLNKSFSKLQEQDSTCAGDKDSNAFQNCDLFAEGEPVPLAEEDADVLRSSPRLLTESQMRQIRDEGLHSTAQIMRWHRSYSLSRDGDSFRTMMEKCGGYRHTIIVCRTTDNDILGGYADEAWKLGGINSFFGGGRAFLFATRPDLSDEDKEWIDLKSGIGRSKKTSVGSKGRSKGINVDDKESNVHESDGQADCEDPRIYVFPWTGTNTYSQVCSVESEQLAMGGGGSFGFIVQEHFSKGSTGPCATFNNPRLIRDPSGCFEIVDLEIYGLKSCLFEGSFASEGNFLQH